MNLAMVIALPHDVADDRFIEARALVDALAAAEEPGDKFSIVLTGSSGSIIVPADDFRHGSVEQVRAWLTGDGENSDHAPLELDEALELAVQLLEDDDSDADSKLLGSRSTLLVTAGALENLDSLLAATHQRAVDGIHLSVVSLGERPDSRSVDQLVLAGLGHRRTLESPADARSLLEDALHAASRAVSRANRLSIRLAPGVGFLGIRGSHPLDEPQAQRVRAIENSMDLQIQQQLGIEVDRGKDEEGIQIVIPTIDSGDEVVFLVDVAVPGTGPVADVSLRYKDLVSSRNASLETSFTLERATGAIGPGERNVRKNQLAQLFSEAATDASDALASGDIELVEEILAAVRARLRAARQSLPQWSNDPDLLNDEQVLGQYLAVLETIRASRDSGTLITMLSDSLRVSAWAKTHQAVSDKSNTETGVSP